MKPELGLNGGRAAGLTLEGWRWTVGTGNRQLENEMPRRRRCAWTLPVSMAPTQNPSHWPMPCARCVASTTVPIGTPSLIKLGVTVQTSNFDCFRAFSFSRSEWLSGSARALPLAGDFCQGAAVRIPVPAGAGILCVFRLVSQVCSHQSFGDSMAPRCATGPGIWRSGVRILPPPPRSTRPI